jgi:hypothetical protein
MKKSISLIILSIAVAGSYFIGLFIETSTIKWHWIDVSAILFGGIGIFSLIWDSSKILPRNQLPYSIKRASAHFQLVIQRAAAFESHVCVKFTRTVDSPSSFDEDQQQHNLACPWAKMVTEYFADLESKELPDIKKEGLLDIPEGVTDRYIAILRNELMDVVNGYLDTRSEVIQLRETINHSDFERFMMFFSPVFVSLAIGLALFKAFHST